MRTFTCLLRDDSSRPPRLSTILADNERRACELVQRELITCEGRTWVEISEGGQVVLVTQIH